MGREALEKSFQLCFLLVGVTVRQSRSLGVRWSYSACACRLNSSNMARVARSTSLASPVSKCDQDCIVRVPSWFMRMRVTPVSFAAFQGWFSLSAMRASPLTFQAAQRWSSAVEATAKRAPKTAPRSRVNSPVLGFTSSARTNN